MNPTKADKDHKRRRVNHAYDFLYLGKCCFNTGKYVQLDPNKAHEDPKKITSQLFPRISFLREILSMLLSTNAHKEQKRSCMDCSSEFLHRCTKGQK
ncbi:hypothetical protein NPIL_331811 [Nephila pilipes]|uniref:Uncharacterized protein n=1 Tax=Nephila pilipes TaxID=299642 RepID=A0A8X6PX73_NEPPI|nr:hypothetical protein NPIL_331811 [Nephila pilipes]